MYFLYNGLKIRKPLPNFKQDIRMFIDFWIHLLFVFIYLILAQLFKLCEWLSCYLGCGCNDSRCHYQLGFISVNLSHWTGSLMLESHKGKQHLENAAWAKLLWLCAINMQFQMGANKSVTVGIHRNSHWLLSFDYTLLQTRNPIADLCFLLYSFQACCLRRSLCTVMSILCGLVFTVTGRHSTSHGRIHLDRRLAN